MRKVIIKDMEGFQLSKSNLLLRFREEIPNNCIENKLEGEYDIKSGLWLNRNGEPLIEKYLVSDENCTDSSRESIGETLMTKSREGIDQSEVTTMNMVGETLITRSREGIDQSEGSGYSFRPETLITCTRESIDRSENS